MFSVGLIILIKGIRGTEVKPKVKVVVTLRVHRNFGHRNFLRCVSGERSCSEVKVKKTLRFSMPTVCASRNSFLYKCFKLLSISYHHIICGFMVTFHFSYVLFSFQQQATGRKGGGKKVQVTEE